MLVYVKDKRPFKCNLLAFKDDGSLVTRVGMTAYAAESLGDVVFVELPDVGTNLVKGTKTDSQIK